jgi:hypothetical protein
VRNLKDIPRLLNRSNIDKAIIDYQFLLDQIPSSIISDNVLELFTKIKREKLNVGPYPNVTLFETANRVMTDLVTLYGIKKLLEGKIGELNFIEYKVEFGNEDNNDNDVSASNDEYELIGEAFNVARSFFQTKKLTALKKMRNQKTNIRNIKRLLIYNSDAVIKEYIPKTKENEFHLAVELNLEKLS